MTTTTAILAWIDNNTELFNAYVDAKATADAECARVDAYILPLLAEYDFRNEYTDEPITNIEELYNVAPEYDNDVDEFYAKAADLHVANGQDPKDHGKSPARIAEGIERDAMMALVDGAAEMLGCEPVTPIEYRKLLGLLLAAR